MSLTPNELMQQIQNELLQLFVKAGAAGTNTVLSFEPIGVMVSPADFKLSPSDSTYSKSKAIEEVSHLSDTLPTINDGVFHRRSLLSIDLLTKLLIQEATASDSDSIAPVSAAKSQMDALYENNSLGSIQGDTPFHPTYATPGDWYDITVTGNWATYRTSTETKEGTPNGPTLGIPSHPVAAPPLSWKHLPIDLAPILKTSLRETLLQEVLPHPPAPAPVGSLNATSTALHIPISGLAEPVNPQRLATTHLTSPNLISSLPPSKALAIRPEAMVTPSALITESAQLRETLLTTPVPAEEDTKAQIAPEALLTHSLSRSALLSANINSASTEQPLEAQEVTISFAYSLVQLSRPWFPEILLMTKGWYVPKYGVNAFATGNASDSQVLYPCIPTAFLAIHNLAISGSWSTSDTEAAANSGALGPFSLLGSSQPTSTSDSINITVPGVQIIAWLCEPLPPMPPDGDPHLIHPK